MASTMKQPSHLMTTFLCNVWAGLEVIARMTHCREDREIHYFVHVAVLPTALNEGLAATSSETLDNMPSICPNAEKLPSC